MTIVVITDMRTQEEAINVQQKKKKLIREFDSFRDLMIFEHLPFCVRQTDANL